ncbi:hypothetical protein BX600DRAFT_546237 [Xylariales sp. PMI_506]|nr:hypothetical protein BX600DRAFT_546237 [Xylariales sp. PMI_506]
MSTGKSLLRVHDAKLRDLGGYANSSYYNKNAQSPALIRARRPYLVKNAILGTGVAMFAMGVYIYTIRAIGQDEFADVKVPDLPQQPAKK